MAGAGRKWLIGCGIGCGTMVLLAVCLPPLSGQTRRVVTDSLLLNPPDDEWITHGRTYAEPHHSPLADINAATLEDFRRHLPRAGRTRQ